MKRAIVKDIIGGRRLVSLGKQLFVTEPAASQEEFQVCRIEKQHNFENLIRFEVKGESFLLMDEQSKGLKSFSLPAILAGEQELKAQT